MLDKYKPYFLLLAIFSVVIGIIFVSDYATADDANSTANVSNSLPEAGSVQLNGGADITLTANQTTQINGTTVITDNNSCEDIVSVTGKLYRSDQTENGSSDSSIRYNATCAGSNDCTAGGGDLTRTYTCYYNMTWYADATDAGSANSATTWTFLVTPRDASGNGTPANVTQEVNTLTALNLLNTTVNFGSLSLGADTGGTNEEIRVENIGNEPLDVQLSGYGSAPADGLALNCTIGTISVGQIEYDTSGFTYGTGTDLSGSATEVDLDVDKGSDGTPRPYQTLLFGLGMPVSGVKGVCNGVLTVTAVSDPGQD